MYAMPRSYYDAIHNDEELFSILISLGTGYDMTAAEDVTSVTGDFMQLSDPSTACNYDYNLTANLAVFQGQGIPTNEGAIVPPMAGDVNPNLECGVWSADISEEDGSIDWTVTINLSEEHESAFRVYNGESTIVEATATFYRTEEGEEVSETVALDCIAEYAQTTAIHRYSKIVVHVTRIAEPYYHCSIPEFDFGAGIVVSNGELGGSLDAVREVDAMEQTIPIDMLNFSLINVGGPYDVDSPSNLYDELSVGREMIVSWRMTANGRRYLLPAGRYFIASKTVSGNLLRVTSYDNRWMLARTYKAWTLNTTDSLRTQLIGLIEAENMLARVDESLDDVTPDYECAFTVGTSILDDLLTLKQRYNLGITAGRGGSIEITAGEVHDSFGDVPVNCVFEWPQPSQLQEYNDIVVRYGDGTGTYELDLRADTELPKSTLFYDNALMQSEAQASAFASRIAAKLYTHEVEVKVVGDPSMDAGDMVGMPGRFTVEEPLVYKVGSISMEYDGLLTMFVKGTN